MVNVPLLRKVVEWVEEQDRLANMGMPSRWNQAEWMTYSPKLREDIIAAQLDSSDPLCGTAMCVAGKIAFDAGWKPALGHSNDNFRPLEGADLEEENDVISHAYNPETGEFKEIATVALGELGLPHSLVASIDEFGGKQLEDLFELSNHAGDVRRIAEVIAGEPL